MSIKRYSVEGTGGTDVNCPFSFMVNDKKGEFVTFEDHEKRVNILKANDTAWRAVVDIITNQIVDIRKEDAL